MSGKRKRVELTLKQKLEIIAACEGFPKRSFAAVAKKFNVDRSTVSKIYKNKETVAEVASSSNINRKRQRSSRAEDVDEALFRWFEGAVGREGPATGEVLRAKAEGLAQELGVGGFLASNGWLDRWKKRYNIGWRREQGEGYEGWVSGGLSGVLRRYRARDVYNAVETGVLWRALPSGWQLVKDGEGGLKGCKDRVTVLVCASMSGEKRPLLVTKMSSSSAKSLPVQHRNFETWLHAWDKELALERRKIALIVDNSEAHARLQLPHIELVLLPANVSSFIQPCHQGVVRALKRNYRRRLLLRLLSVIESSDQDTTALQLTNSIDFFGSIRLLKESWDSVTTETVLDSFRKAKFCEEATGAETEALPFIKEEIDLEPFTQCGDGGCPGEEEEPETEIETKPVTKSEALKALEALQTFLSSGGLQDWRHFNQLEGQVQHLILSNTKRIPQSSLKKWIKQDK